MHLKSPADELAGIHAQIARLRAREGELRAAYLASPEMPRVGRLHQIELVTHRQRVFDPRLLPDEIRHDPAYTREKVTRVLRATRKPREAVIEQDETMSEAAELIILRPLPRAWRFAGLMAH